MSKVVFEKDFPRHPLHYFSLLCIQLVGLWGVFWFGYDRMIQFAIVVAMSVSFVIWGIIHHKEHHNLHQRIVIEYILVALLAILAFGSLVL